MPSTQHGARVQRLQPSVVGRIQSTESGQSGFGRRRGREAVRTVHSLLTQAPAARHVLPPRVKKGREGTMYVESEDDRVMGDGRGLETEPQAVAT